MSGLRSYLVSRAPGQLLAIVAVVSAVVLVQPGFIIVIDLARDGVGRSLPLLEAVPVLAACAVAAAQGPRFLEWDRLGTWRPRVAAALVVPVCAVLCVVPVLLGATRLPAQATWTYIPANVVVVLAVAFVLCVLLGPGPGSAGSAILYVAMCVLQDFVPAARDWAPVAAPPGRDGQWLVAAAFLAAAMVVQARTLGASELARRLRSNVD